MDEYTRKINECRRLRGEQFLSELKQLLSKYEAVISADDEWQGYPECGQDVRIRVEGDYARNAGEPEHWGFSIDIGNRLEG